MPPAPVRVPSQRMIFFLLVLIYVKLGSFSVTDPFLTTFYYFEKRDGSYVRIGGRGLENLPYLYMEVGGGQNCQNHPYVINEWPPSAVQTLN